MCVNRQPVHAAQLYHAAHLTEKLYLPDLADAAIVSILADMNPCI